MMRPVAPAGAGVASGIELEAKGARTKKDETLEAARQFEALMLKHVLASLEKTTSIGGSRKSGANGTYQSMVVDALADGLAQAGGLGLSDLIAKMLEGELGGPAK
jgi:Rod binding domain-containing protein